MKSIALREGEELISVRMTDGNSEILMATRGAWPSTSARRTSAKWAVRPTACGASTST
jgi:hypothetical protein